MNLYDEHERFARKNAMLARGYEVKKTDEKLEKKGVSNLREGDATCFNCKFKDKCRTFEKMRTGGNAGAVSFGGGEKFLCDRYEIMKSQKIEITDKQIKSLLKNAMKGNL